MRMRGLAPLLLIALTACGAGGFKDDVENKAIPRFHEQFNANQFNAIYGEATQRFRDATPKSDFDKFISAVRRKLGRSKSSTRQTWNVQAGTGGTQIVMTYNTQFEQGSGTETFTYVKTGSGPKLLGYRINSNALITQ